MNLWEFFKSQFDKILLLTLTLIYVFPAIHGSAYAQRTSDLVLGALLGLLTGKITQSLTKE